MKVDVYFNLHKKLYSIRACEGPNKGKVIAHRHTVTLIDPTFKVSQAGRARVIKEKKKNVHATVRGDWFDPADKLGCNPFETRIKKRGREITYNPYQMCSFSYWNDIGELHGFHRADAAFLCAETNTRMALYPRDTDKEIYYG